VPFFFLKFRPRSKQEVNKYLNEKAEKNHWPPVVVEKTLQRLEELKFINDADFLNWYVGQRSARRAKSERAIRSELYRFGIDKELIEDYFQTHPLPEEELALQALSPRWLRLQHLDSQTQLKKAASFLGRRGFSFSIIQKTIAKLRQKR
jgi:regulatory protein